MSIPSFSLEGKVAIVTGAKRGIGRAIALVLAEAGADVAVATRVVKDANYDLEAVAEEIRGLGRRSLAVQADVAKKSDVDNLVQKTVSELGGIDVLVNSAGITTRTTPMEISEEEWDRILDTDLKGCLLCAQATGKRMIEQKRGGSIINLSSVAAVTSPVNRAGYASAKLGVIMLTRQLAKQLGPYNIRVNTIIPGFIKTEMSRDMWSNPKKLKQELVMIPMNRWGEPVEIANIALMLASDVASYVSGVALAVDGGMTA